MEREENVLATESSEPGLLQRNAIPRDGDDAVENQPLLGVREAIADASSSEYSDPSLPWWKRPSIIWMLPPFLLYATAWGAIAVPRLNLINDLVCQDYYKEQEMHLIPGTFNPVKLVLGDENALCDLPEVTGRTAMFTLYLNLIAGLLSAVAAPRLGQLSDRYGRRSLMLMATSGGLVAEIIAVACFKWPDHVSRYWLMAASTVDGCLGSFSLTLALTHSYAADCTPPEKRAASFGLFHGCLFLGIAIGPALGGLLIKATDSLLSVFYGTIICHALFMLYIAAFLPESLTKARQKLAREKWTESRRRLAQTSGSWMANLQKLNVFEPFNIFWPNVGRESKKIRLNMFLLAAIDFIMFGVGFGALTVVILYTKSQFHWSVEESSYFVSIVNSCRVVGLLIILPTIIRVFRKPLKPGEKAVGCDSVEVWLIRGTLVLEIVGYLHYLIARNAWLFILGGIIASFGGMGSPTLQSALTKHAPREKTGQLLGAVALSHATARVIGPSVFNYLYRRTASTFPQAVFVMLVSGFGLAFVASLFITPHLSVEIFERNEEEEEEHREADIPIRT